MGIDGSPGTTGRDGPPGRPGRTGHKGEAGDCHCKESYVTPPNAAEKGTLKKAGNLVYTMWGSSTCPFTSDILFSGISYALLFISMLRISPGISYSIYVFPFFTFFVGWTAKEHGYVLS